MDLGERCRRVGRAVRDTALRTTPQETRRARLWPGDPPGGLGDGSGDAPTYSVYVPDRRRATGAGVVVFPGGGYSAHAEHEAGPVGRRLRSLGIAAMVVRYRLAPRHRHPAMLLDAAQAVRTMRSKAAAWGIEPSRVGVLGFSAGGHLAAHVSTCWREVDEGGETSRSRPDFTVLIYPVICMVGPDAHSGCRSALLGGDGSEELARSVSVEQHVTTETPPAFVVHGRDDEVVSVGNSVAYARACAAAGVHCELRLLTNGPHGFGLGAPGSEAAEWPDRMAAWLRRLGAR